MSSVEEKETYEKIYQDVQRLIEKCQQQQKYKEKAGYSHLIDVIAKHPRMPTGLQTAKQVKQFFNNHRKPEDFHKKSGDTIEGCRCIRLSLQEIDVSESHFEQSKSIKINSFDQVHRSLQGYFNMLAEQHMLEKIEDKEIEEYTAKDVYYLGYKNSLIPRKDASYISVSLFKFKKPQHLKTKKRNGYVVEYSEDRAHVLGNEKHETHKWHSEGCMFKIGDYLNLVGMMKMHGSQFSHEKIVLFDDHITQRMNGSYTSSRFTTISSTGIVLDRKKGFCPEDEKEKIVGVYKRNDLESKDWSNNEIIAFLCDEKIVRRDNGEVVANPNNSIQHLRWDNADIIGPVEEMDVTD